MYMYMYMYMYAYMYTSKYNTYMCMYQYVPILYMWLVCSCRAIPTFSFVDYIRGGCQISLMVAIDFTVSLT